jgi:PAS domain-containing protein
LSKPCASEERLRLAVWTAELGVFEWNMLTDQAAWENQRMYEIFWRAPQDGPLSKAEFIEQVIHPDDRVGFEAALAEAMQSGQLFHTTCRIRRQDDGETRWVEYSGRFKRDREGMAYLLTGVIGDITGRSSRREASGACHPARAAQSRAARFAYIASTTSRSRCVRSPLLANG